MDDKQLHYIIVCIALVVACGIGFVFYCLFKMDLKAKAMGKLAEVREDEIKKIQRSAEKRTYYAEIERMMRSRGITYRMGDRFTPFDYNILRFMVSLGLGLLMMLITPMLGILGIFLGYYLVPEYFKYMDEQDNLDMLQDLVVVNRIIALQSMYSVFLSKMVYECWFAVKNPRLARALLELSIDIDNFSSVDEAVGAFADKFTNPHIETFAKSLAQIDVTGSSSKLFEDMENSMASLNRAISIRRQQKTKRVTNFVTFLVFLVPMIIGVYLFTLTRGSISQLI